MCLCRFQVDENSEFDVVEIDAKLVAATVSAAVVGASDQQERKIEWLLDSGLDECVDGLTSRSKRAACVQLCLTS